MALFVAWILLVMEALVAGFFAYVFWSVWSRTPMDRSVRIRAIVIYILGCLACIGLAFALPL